MRLIAAVLLSAAVAAHAAAQTQLPLALATFDEAWSIVNRTYYDPAFRGVDWQAVRDELRPEAERARTPADLRATITRMLARLGESHFAVLPQFADPGIEADSIDRSGSPGFEVRPDAGGLLITKLDPTSPAHRAGLRAGDRIRAVDGTEVSARAVRLPADLEPRVRALEMRRAGMMRLRGPAGSRANVTLEQPGGRTRDVSFTRVEEPGQTVLLGNLPPLRLRVDAEAAETPSGAAAGVIGFNVWMAAADAPFAA